MGSRVVAGGAALGFAVGLVVVAVLAATGSGGAPTPLPVLGGGGAPTGAAAEPAATSSARTGITYEVDGTLDELDGEARAWSVATDADVERITALARALGLTGQVGESPTGWQVEGDGGRVLDVQRQPGLPWSFWAWSGGGSSGSSASVTAEARATPPEQTTPPAGSGDDQVVCDMPHCPPGTACVQVCPPDDMAPPVDLPTRDEALERAAAIFSAAGIDMGAADVRADRYGSWSVSADPQVGGLPTVGMASTVTIGAEGAVDHAGGWLAEPQRGDVYALVGTTEALRLLGENHPVALSDGREPATVCLECPPVEPVVVTVTGVRLGLELVAAYDAEEAWLVPAYLFETREGGPGPDLVTFAVSDDDLVAPPGPPAPDPGRPEPVPIDPAAPVEPPPGGQAGGGCAAVMAAGVAGNVAGSQPPTLEVCQVGAARVGEVVTFELKATDADSAIRDDCGSPVVAFGDEPGGVAVCDIGCVSLAPGPGELHRSFEHVYAEPGTYTTTFTLVGCGPDDPSISASLPISVSP